MKYSPKYINYIASDEWRGRKQAKLDSSKRCSVCGETEGLQLHHKNYDRLGEERSDNLVLLCKACHWIMDSERKGDKKIGAKYKSFRKKHIDHAPIDPERRQPIKHASIKNFRQVIG